MSKDELVQHCVDWARSGELDRSLDGTVASRFRLRISYHEDANQTALEAILASIRHPHK